MHDIQPSKSFIASIHDVRPGLLKETDSMLQWLKDHGIGRVSLLVVPNFHDRDPIIRNGRLHNLLLKWQDMGHEIVLHSYYHREEKPERQSVWQYVVSQIHTAGHGEFYRLNYQQSVQRIEKGLNCLHSLGLKRPRGFVAPAWLYSQASRDAIRDCGFDYYTTIWTIELAQLHKSVPSRAIVWSNRKAWRRAVSVSFIPALGRRVIHQQQPFRLALHPPDFDHRSCRKSIAREVARAMSRSYRPMTYSEWLEEFNELTAAPSPQVAAR